MSRRSNSLGAGEESPVAATPGEVFLEQRSALQTALLDSIPGGRALILKKGSREIVAMNTVAREMGGTVGKTCYEAAYWRDTPCPFCLAPQLWATGAPQDAEVEYEGKWYRGVWAPLSENLYVHHIFDVTERKRLEEQLSESARQLSSIYQTVGDAIFQVAVEPEGRYRFVSINSAFCRTTGLSPEMVVGKYVADVIPEPAVSRVFQRYRQAIDERAVVRWEETSEYPTGTLTGDVTVAPVYDAEGRCTHLVGSVHDLTEVRRSEEQLRLTQFSIDHAVDSVYWLDPAGRLVYVSDSTCARLGYSRDELLSMTIFDLNPELSSSDWQTNWNALRQQRAVAMETVHRRRDGSAFPVEINLNFVEYGDRTYNCVFARDISERKRAEEDYQRLFNGMLDACALHEVILDENGGSVNLRFLAVNPAFELVMGRKARDIVGMTTREIGPGLDPEWIETLSRVALSGVPTTFERYDPSLDKHFIVSVFVPAPRQLAIIFSDVTDRKLAESNLRERDEQLRQAQKMEAIGQLAGGIAHDFNNLLTAILGYSELALSENEALGPRVRKDIEQVKHAAERASTLTKQILAFSRRQALRPEVASLNAVLVEMESLLRRTLGEDVDLTTILDPDLGHAEIDVHQFEQVLMNLAVNARDAMPIGGRLTVETANVELGEDYCRSHADVSPGRYVMLSVSDTGMGIDESTQSHIFEPFFTTKEPGAGTGLGLSTVYGIVKQSGGSIMVYSEPGRGTVFKVYLPSVMSPLEDIPLSVATSPSSAGHEVVLLVEDEEALRTLSERILGDAGYTVLVAADANKALQLLAAGDVVPDVLLTDVVLPGGMQGNDLARKLLASRPDLPVLYMSGYTRNAIVHAGRLDEKVNYLEKPFTPEALIRVLRRVIDQALSSGNPRPER